MTIGDAIKAERLAKGWTIEEVAERMPRRFTVSHIVDIERYADWGSMPSSTLYELARVGLDPIGRMVEAERLAKESDLFRQDAKWRENPIEAAEAVVGGKWEEDAIGWELRSKFIDGYIADTRCSSGFYVYDGFGEDSNTAYRCPTSVSMGDASVALVELVVKGEVILPKQCPGVAALLEMEGGVMLFKAGQRVVTNGGRIMFVSERHGEQFEENGVVLVHPDNVGHFCGALEMGDVHPMCETPEALRARIVDCFDWMCAADTALPKLVSLAAEEFFICDAIEPEWEWFAHEIRHQLRALNSSGQFDFRGE